jgi:hypothetical protein
VLHDLVQLGQYRFHFCGVTVSQGFYLCTHNITHHILEAGATLYHKLMHGKAIERPTPGPGRKAEEFSAVLEWLTDKWLPEVSMTNARNEEKHICFNPIAVWVWRECTAAIGHSVSYSTFLRAYHVAMHDVSVPRTGSDLKSCGRCFLLMLQHMHAMQSGDHDVADECKTAMSHHISTQYAGKLVYWHCREQVWTGGALHVLLLSMDGTRPINIPALVRRTDLSDGLPLVRFQVMSIIVHNEHNDNSGRIGFYIGAGHETANVDVSYLDAILAMPALQVHRDQLRLILDGGSAAKSWPMVCYLAWLVESGRFREVLVQFSHAGHGGDMNDGMTSHLRNGVRKNLVCSPQSMLDHWSKMFPSTPRPTPMFFSDLRLKDGQGEPEGQLGLMYDWKTLFEPCWANLSGYCQQNVENPDNSIHMWRFSRGDGGFAMLQVKRLAQDPDSVYSNSVRVLLQQPSGKPSRLWFHNPNNTYVGTLFERPIVVCDTVLSTLGLSMSKSDHLWWKSYRALVERCKMPTQYAKPERKTTRAPRAKVPVDLSKPPELHQGRKASSQSKGIMDNADVVNEDVEEDPDNLTLDGEDPEYHVERIVSKEVRDGVVFYHVAWAEPYNDITWEPVTNLVHCQAKIDEFETAQEGLRHYNKAHAELGHEIREQEAQAAAQHRVMCQFCQREFAKRGLATHQRSCKSQSAE